MPWPNFLLIGAAKSGTTSVYRYLQQHPQVFLSSPKEPRFFAFEGSRLDYAGLRGDGWRHEFYTDRERYLELFAGVRAEKAVGEASVMYLSEPGTAERIRRYVPDMKIMAILRDPVERAYSNFAFMRAEGREPIADFEEALRAEDQRKRENWISWFHYRGRGMYGEHLARYMEQFARARIRVWLYEDLLADPARLMREVFEFLEIDDGFAPDLSQRHNVTRIAKHEWLGRWTKGRRSLQWLADWNQASKPAFSAEARARLRESYGEDLTLAEKLTGRDLSAWRRA